MGRESRVRQNEYVSRRQDPSHRHWGDLDQVCTSWPQQWLNSHTGLSGLNGYTLDRDKCQFVFDYNSHVSSLIFIIFYRWKRE